MKNVLLIMNGMAGNGRNGSSTFRIVKNFASKGLITTVCPVAEGVELDTADYLADKEYDLVVCMGGDGTINAAVNRLMKLDKRPILGYIPAGTTNDFSKNLKLVRDVDKACELITSGRYVNYDVGCFNGHYFNYVAAFGAFSAISYNTDQKAKNTLGYAAYILNAIISAPEHLATKCHLRMEVDGDVIEGDYSFGGVCNSLSVGGQKLPGITTSNLYDGAFELFLIKYPENPADLTEILYALLQGDFGNEHFVFRKVKKAHIYSQKNVEWTLDGEYGGSPEEVDFEIIPGAIRIASAISADQ
ncbi:MAG: diacylglycerol kinase family lipid kinase [Oscillospiraceae bacterium]|nr:diacylglycerol kinase family lipid kinase [Oscillospiraceae bacterium]